MSVKMTCNGCGDTYESDDVLRVISWSKSHDDSCGVEKAQPAEQEQR